MNHTPTPWKVDKEMKRNGARIITADICWMGNSRQVAKLLYHNGSEDPEIDANARFIITACNAHEELVAMVKEFIQDYQEMGIGDKQTVQNAQQLLATIEKGESSC